jgi:xylulokinase
MLDTLASQAPAGSRGLHFAAHLFGERAPYPDARLRGAFVGLGLDHGRPEMARAVLEGVALNLRGIVDGMRRLGRLPRHARVVGGGARSDTWLGILADVLGLRLVRMRRPELAGAIGVALTAAVGVGALPQMSSIAERLESEREFAPDAATSSLYASALARLTKLRPTLSRDARTDP